MSNAPVTVVLQFAARSYTYGSRSYGEALDKEEDDNIDRIASAIPVDLIIVGCFVKVDI